MVTSLITSSARPSYHQGFAIRSLSRRPNLWQQAYSICNPSLGVSGSKVFDLSGKGNNAVLTNMPASSWIVTPEGYGVDFDGVNDHLIISGFDVNSDWTFAVQCRWDVLTGQSERTILSQKNGSGTGRSLIYGKTTDSIIKSNLGGAEFESGLSIVIGEITNIVFSHDDTADTVSWYKDGVIGNVNTTVGAEANDGDFVIGAAKSTTAQELDGAILKIIFYNRTFTPSEAIDWTLKPSLMFQPKDRFVGRVPVAAVTVPDQTLAPTMQMAGSGGIIGAVNV